VIIALAVFGWLALSVPAASAAVEGPCTATFNGVDVDRIDTIASPLELGAEDTLVFQGTDEEGTQQVDVEVKILMVTVDSEAVTYGPLEGEFRADLDLGGMSPYAVGLFRVRGTTDNCTVEAWLRVSGRIPLATLVGLAAAGVTVGGATAVIGAIASRRRFSPLTATLAGIATGIGGAMLGQVFGRLQISYVSLGVSAGAAALIGFLAAWFLRERPERYAPQDDEHDRRFHDERAAPSHRSTGEHEPFTRSSGEHTPVQRSMTTPSTPATHTEPMARTAEPSMNGGPYWCYVMGAIEVLDLDDHDTVVGSLQPGTWYLAKREVGGWAHVVVRDGLEGWVPQTAVHRQG
jgi:hypothetical protein